MLHPDIQYQLCRMEQNERIGRALRSRQVREARLAKRVSADSTLTTVRRVRQALATTLVSVFSLGGR
jgi:hypothetical protein